MSEIARQRWSAERYAETAHFVHALGRKKLEQAHFTVEEIAIVPRPTTLPTGIDAWLDTFAEDFLGPLLQPDRSRARAEIADLLRPVLMDETGTWISDYVRLRFRATRAE